MKKDEILDIEQVAALLRISQGKVKRWVQQGQIPCKFKGKACRFKKKEVVDWAKARNLWIAEDRPAESAENGSAVSLKTGIEKGGVYFNLEGGDAYSAFKKAVEMIPFPPPIDRQKVLEALISREEIASTGLGRGVAIPHPRRPLSSGPFMIPVFFLKDGIDFSSIDGKPVWVLFFLFSPSTQVHLHLLSKLSYCLREQDFLDSLRRCRTFKAVIKLIEEHESRLDRRAAK